MAVYVDTLINYGNNSKWKYGESCHMLSDTIEELNTFALLIGLKLEWFQSGDKHTIPHYDLTSNKRKLAVNKGAIEINRNQFIEKIKNYKTNQQ